VGIANEHSIAYGCASAFRQLGAELAITYLNEKAKSYVKPLADQLGAAIFMPLDVSVQGQLEAVFDAIDATWGDSTCSFTRSPSLPRRISRAVCSTVRPGASPKRWTSRVIRSCAWPNAPRR